MKLNDLIKMAMHKPSPQRFIEIDVLRGLAIILMVIGHLFWDLDYFGLAPMNNAYYNVLSKTVPPLFFLLVGISLVVSRKKMESQYYTDEKEYNKHILVRGLKIFCFGMFLTIFSLLFIPDRPVFFGVLHCIGISIVLSLPFLKYRKYALLFGLFIVFAGILIAHYPMDNPSLVHFAIGFQPAEIWRYTVDYFPLLPWFGLALIGISIGDWLYCGNIRAFKMPDLSKYRPTKIFQWAGQHSLGIYLIHQPVIAGIITIFILL